jgi:8-oxo-dGTP diphosphatase
MRDWTVAGALIMSDDRLLLVANRRRDGRIEWTPPGGVVDPGETSLEALGREVREETGLEVASWSDLVYRVSVDFPDRGMRLGVEVFRAELWSGDLIFEDPDGIVEDGVFVDEEDGGTLLETAPRWVSEPVGDWLAGGASFGAGYDFLVRGTHPGHLDVTRR